MIGRTQRHPHILVPSPVYLPVSVPELTSLFPEATRLLASLR